MEDDWLLPSSADAPRDDAPDPDPDLIRTLEANRAGWLARRCKSAHWGIYRLTQSAECPDDKTRGRYAVRCSICGTRYAVDPHVGGSFLKRHVTGKHPGAWTWWSARCAALDLAERTHRAGPRVAAEHGDGDDDDDGDGDGDEKDVATMKRRPPRSSRRSDAGGKNPGDKRARIGEATTQTQPAAATQPAAFAERRGVDGAKARNANPGSHIGAAGGGDAAAGIAAMCQDCEPCELRPKAFFVAWSGVMTLAWEGFPPAMASLKRRIARAFPALSPEKPGSRWAKTTLGCLKEGARLTPAELASLVDLCERFGERFGKIAATPGEGAEEGVEGVAASPGCVPVDGLSVVLFQCRSLERVLSEHVVSFRNDGIVRDRDRPSRDETAVVDAVLRESSRECLEKYWPLAARDGGREPHYRDDKFGATLVARLRRPPRAVAEFRAAVDAALPGMYAWFHDDSLHVTLRGLVDPP